MDSETIDADAKATTTEEPSPPTVVDTKVSEVAASAASSAAHADDADAELTELSDESVPASTADVGLGVGEHGPGRLSSLVPTLGRFATRAHKASAPYLSYAAQASQEAARWVPQGVGCCKSSVGGVSYTTALLIGICSLDSNRDRVSLNTLATYDI